MSVPAAGDTQAQSPSFPSSTWSAQSGACAALPGARCISLCAATRPSLGLLTVLPQPPCNADCTWIWEGQTHEKHHRITNTPDCRKMNVLPKRSGMRRVTFHSVPVSEISVLMICPRATLQNVNVLIKIPCDRLQILIKGTWGCMFVCLFVCFHAISVFFVCFFS